MPRRAFPALLLLLALLAVWATHHGHQAAPTAAPALGHAAPAAQVAPTAFCWVEHKDAADGGDETLCGPLGLMPAGSTLLGTEQDAPRVSAVLGQQAPAPAPAKASGGMRTAEDGSKVPASYYDHTAGPACEEDQPCWDPATMGNGRGHVDAP